MSKRKTTKNAAPKSRKTRKAAVKKASATAAAPGTPVEATPVTAPETKAKALSGLDAAAQVLAAAGKPMTTQEMVKAMFDQGLWSSSGKTPAATIYSAIIREIAAKGTGSRFHKTDRGKFASAQ